MKDRNLWHFARQTRPDKALKRVKVPQKLSQIVLRLQTVRLATLQPHVCFRREKCTDKLGQNVQNNVDTAAEITDVIFI